MASLVEFVEALTVVLAVGTVRGWRSALMGTGSALALLVLLVVLLGGSMTHIPFQLAQLIIGTLLLMFGLRWLRKAILRYAGVIPMHDEEAEFKHEAELMRRGALPRARRWDQIAFAAAFKIVMLEGIEVVFIVIAIGAGGRLIVPAALGALAALTLVAGLGLWLHRPLAKVPENALKFGVGVLLASFGTFWVGEGVGLPWPAADGALGIVIAAYFVTAQALVRICRSVDRPGLRGNQKKEGPAANNPVISMIAELLALFIDDARLATGICLWSGLNWWLSGFPTQSAFTRSGVFLAGFIALLIYSAVAGARKKRGSGLAA
jgi:Ca2+/H+ antiporter, TMEM165/GDT1 family